MVGWKVVRRLGRARKVWRGMMGGWEEVGLEVGREREGERVGARAPRERKGFSKSGVRGLVRVGVGGGERVGETGEWRGRRV